MMQRQSQAIFLMMILLASLIIIPTETKADESESDNSWDPLWQPWAQYGRDAGHSREFLNMEIQGLLQLKLLL